MHNHLLIPYFHLYYMPVQNISIGHNFLTITSNREGLLRWLSG